MTLNDQISSTLTWTGTQTDNSWSHLHLTANYRQIYCN